MKQASEFKLLFKRPITRDWIFYVYLVFLVIDSLGSMSKVVGQGGPFLDNSVSVVSGSIDALTHLIVSYLLVLPILIVRRIIEASRSRKGVNPETAKAEVVILNEVPEKAFIQQIRNRFNSKSELHLLLCSSTLVILAVLLPYDERIARLIDDAGNKTYNLFPILLIVGLTVFVYFRNSDQILIMGLVPLVYWHFQGIVSNIGNWITGSAEPRIGALLELANFVLLVFLTISIGRRVSREFVWTAEKLRTAIGLTFLGILYVVGSWMNWTKTTQLITIGDSTWKLNDSQQRSKSCCTLFDDPENWPWQARDFVMVVGLFVTLYLLLYLASSSNLGFGIFSLGLVLLSNPLSWIASVYPKYLDPVTEGFDAKEIEELGIVVYQEPLVGGWIALGAAAAYLFYGLYIYASSKIIASPTRNQNSM
jgi:hypothetical protein